MVMDNDLETYSRLSSGGIGIAITLSTPCIDYHMCHHRLISSPLLIHFPFLSS
jgi:hypothetical protein